MRLEIDTTATSTAKRNGPRNSSIGLLTVKLLVSKLAIISLLIDTIANLLSTEEPTDSSRVWAEASTLSS